MGSLTLDGLEPRRVLRGLRRKYTGAALSNLSPRLISNLLKEHIDIDCGPGRQPRNDCTAYMLDCFYKVSHFVGNSLAKKLKEFGPPKVTHSVAEFPVLV